MVDDGAVDLPVLHAECDKCAGLCCVLLPFSRVDGFGVDKAGGVACANLTDDDRCGIHDRLSTSGWAGCVRFDCFGAGQQVTQRVYEGRGWRGRTPGELAEMGAVLSVVRQLHEVLALLTGARKHPAGAGFRDAIDSASAAVAQLGDGTPEELLTLDLDAVRGLARPALDDVARTAASAWPDREVLTRADLAGADLRGRDLRGASLRGALLIGADLRDVDLADADLLGADLRGADARGARLDRAVHLTHVQRQALRFT